MKQKNPDPETIRAAVRRRYGSIANRDSTFARSHKPDENCCGSTAAAPSSNGCCLNDQQARKLGYTKEDLAAVPEGANLGLGCGDPVSLASLKPRQAVLDLGSGRGLAVALTPAMLTKARANAKKGGYANVEFRLGEIEALPVADATVDVVISNCVINLCPDKRPVYREAFRALRQGGRLAVSDVVAREELPAETKRDLALYTGCLAGATLQADLLRILEEAGFTEIAIKPRGNSDQVVSSWESKRGFESKVFAAEITAVKPGGACCASSCCA